MKRRDRRRSAAQSQDTTTERDEDRPGDRIVENVRREPAPVVLPRQAFRRVPARAQALRVPVVPASRERGNGNAPTARPTGAASSRRSSRRTSTPHERPGKEGGRETGPPPPRQSRTYPEIEFTFLDPEFYTRRERRAKVRRRREAGRLTPSPRAGASAPALHPFKEET